MKEFDNEFIRIAYISQYVASWVKEGGTLDYDEDLVYGGRFMKWLMAIGLTEEEARRIRNFADNGKLELEESARSFLKENK